MPVVLSLRMHTSELGILLDGILKRERGRKRGRKRKDYRHPPCMYADSKAHVQTWVWIDPQTNEDKQF